MAASLTITGQNRTVLVRSPTLTEDAMEITAIAQPSGIGFVRVILYTTWLNAGTHAALIPIADHIEQIVEHHHIVGGGPVQQISAAGLVTNYVEFVVTVASQAGIPEPTHTAPVRVPVQALHDASDFTHYFAPIEHALAAGIGG